MNEKVNLKSILIIDDDQEVRALLKSLLAKHFSDVNIHEYDPIERGEPANGFDWSMFDVLILDQYLCIHELTGLDLFQKHHKSPGFPPTIMVTAAGNEALVIRALKSGIKEYIRKEDMNSANLSEAVHKAYEEHHVNQNVQQELEAEEKRIQEDRSQLETDAAVINSQLQEIEEEKNRIQQEATNEVQRLKSEAEEQIQIEREELAKESVALKAQLDDIEKARQSSLEATNEFQRIESETEEQIQKEREELAKESAAVKAQLEDIEKARQSNLEATNKFQQIESEAEEKIQKEREELAKESAVVKAEFKNLEEEKRMQQDAMDAVQQADSETESQIQKEYEELKKEVSVVKEKLLKAVKGYSKIKKENDVLLKDRAIVEVERQKHATEMAMAKEKIKDVNRALVATQTKQKVFEEEKQEIITKDVIASNEVSGDEEVLNLTRSKAPLDADELLDSGQQTQEQGDSKVSGAEEVLDLTKSQAPLDTDELLDSGQQT
ncbi:MAG: hypothetical protein DRQ58_07940, partial [Gammaproteobacteria bacterium]